MKKGGQKGGQSSLDAHKHQRKTQKRQKFHISPPGDFHMKGGAKGEAQKGGAKGGGNIPEHRFRPAVA